MLLRPLLVASFLLSPVQASAHNFVVGKSVQPVSIADRGELLLDNQDEFSYRSWNSSELAGKVRIVQYIAGRTSAKKKNSLLIKAVKKANFPQDRFQPTTIVNTDDVIFGSGFFVLGKIEKNKRHYPWAQFIIDSDGLGRKTWQLNEMSSTILVLDKDGHILWAKDGNLTPKEVQQVISMVRKVIGESSPL
ncbi:YtfJ family protein [Citrobacter enshiensis]|uniref:YtfJ family protein n=1 Tax=Citrobacter enshiensis TaxID=2971264 RepID=A0ABT8PTX5_9ENTR|nr:YtfJ family protein [Citrobacter enshiensis]MDN8599785.1 YtfJ family protein [Citrobacter enshiensis]WET42808.1 YtfJ family protein [Citrobacter enshiensis]